MYKIRLEKFFISRYNKLTKRNGRLKKKIKKTIILLAQNPHHSSLRTHKVQTRKIGKKYSSSVSSDIRIIWNFDKNENLIILVLDIGSHTGKHKVYN